MKTSHSSRATFRACKRKYHWSYRVGIEQVRKPKALRMGSAWSDALEFGPRALSEFYEPLFYTAPEWDMADLEHELSILKALRATYPFSQQEVRESPFKHLGAGYEDRGQLDGIVDLEDGLVGLIENKLFARFGDREAEKLEFDEQIDSYVTALVDGEVEGYEAGVPLGSIRILYNVTLKPALRIGKQTQKDYTARCVADIYARPDHYHKQYKPGRTLAQLQDFRERRDKHVMDLMYEEEMGVWERNPSACFDYGQCPFLKICRTPNVEAVPEGYQKKEERT